MIAVDQRHLACPIRNDGHDADGIAGDCARAAWATLLEVPYEQVPHFAHYPAEWDADADPLTDEHGGLYWRRVRRWLRTLDLDVTYLDARNDRGRVTELRQADGYPWSGAVLLSGPSPRGPFDHIVVGRYEWWPTFRPGRLRPVLSIVHDPHPSRAGLVSVEGIDVMVPPYEPGPPPEPWDDLAVAP